MHTVNKYSEFTWKTLFHVHSKCIPSILPKLKLQNERKRDKSRCIQCWCQKNEKSLAYLASVRFVKFIRTGRDSHISSRSLNQRESKLWWLCAVLHLHDQSQADLFSRSTVSLTIYFVFQIYYVKYPYHTVAQWIEINRQIFRILFLTFRALFITNS